MKVTGKNVVVYIKDGDNWKLYACGTSVTLTLTTDILETSVAGNGRFATFVPTKHSWTAALEGVTSLEEDSMLSLPDLRARQISQEILLIKFQRTSGGASYIEEGSCFITSSEDTGSYDSMNTFTIGVQGTGGLNINPDEPENVAFSYQYGTSQINTIIVPGFGALFPSESDFVASVDDVFTSGSALTGTAENTGDDVRIDFSTPTGDWVRFLQMPVTEAPFTKWSEENNPFQQNQPIDQSFNILTGNTWFKSERDGNPLYMTYSQTFFTGAIIFSR